MQVPLALLADFAVAHEDGKLYVTGGGIRSLNFPAFPATQPRLALALGLELAADELGKPHSMSIETIGPAEEPPVKPFAVSFTVAPDATEGGGLPYFHFVRNMENISFPAEGDYAFMISIDGQTLRDVPLRVKKTIGPVPPGAQADVRLMEGYRAFLASEIALAEEIFRDVTVQFPTNPGGHNNLGFVLLAKGEGEAAKRAFLKAREFGYVQPELNDANVACADYLLGDPGAALIIFKRCLEAYGFKGQAVLYGIGASGLFPVQLRSASDYVALMMLNAAWSSLRVGDRVAATQYRAAAGAAELSRREDASAQQFALSIRALETQAA